MYAILNGKNRLCLHVGTGYGLCFQYTGQANVAVCVCGSWQGCRSISACVCVLRKGGCEGRGGRWWDGLVHGWLLGYWL